MSVTSRYFILLLCIFVGITPTASHNLKLSWIKSFGGEQACSQCAHYGTGVAWDPKSERLLVSLSGGYYSYPSVHAYDPINGTLLDLIRGGIDKYYGGDIVVDDNGYAYVVFYKELYMVWKLEVATLDKIWERAIIPPEESSYFPYSKYEGSMPQTSAIALSLDQRTVFIGGTAGKKALMVPGHGFVAAIDAVSSNILQTKYYSGRTALGSYINSITVDEGSGDLMVSGFVEEPKDEASSGFLMMLDFTNLDEIGPGLFVDKKRPCYDSIIAPTFGGQIVAYAHQDGVSSAPLDVISGRGGIDVEEKKDNSVEMNNWHGPYSSKEDQHELAVSSPSCPGETLVFVAGRNPLHVAVHSAQTGDGLGIIHLSDRHSDEEAISAMVEVDGVVFVTGYTSIPFENVMGSGGDKFMFVGRIDVTSLTCAPKGNNNNGNDGTTNSSIGANGLYDDDTISNLDGNGPSSATRNQISYMTMMIISVAIFYISFFSSR